MSRRTVDARQRREIVCQQFARAGARQRGKQTPQRRTAHQKTSATIHRTRRNEWYAFSVGMLLTESIYKQQRGRTARYRRPAARRGGERARTSLCCREERRHAQHGARLSVTAAAQQRLSRAKRRRYVRYGKERAGRRGSCAQHAAAQSVTPEMPMAAQNVSCCASPNHLGAMRALFLRASPRRRPPLPQARREMQASSMSQTAARTKGYARTAIRTPSVQEFTSKSARRRHYLCRFAAARRPLPSKMDHRRYFALRQAAPRRRT